MERSGSSDPGGADPNQIQQNSTRPRQRSEKGVSEGQAMVSTKFMLISVEVLHESTPCCLSRLQVIVLFLWFRFFLMTLSCSPLVGISGLRPPRTNRSRTTKDKGPATGIKKSVITVVLTEDATFPG